MTLYGNLKEGDGVGMCIFIEYTGKNHKRALTAKLKCFCGNTFNAALWEVAKYPTRCCGCLKGNRGEKNGRFIHGDLVGGNGSTEYHCWNGMKDRCYNPENKSYYNYGQRGIIVCDRWLGKYGFVNFLNDLGRKPSNDLSIERINNNGNYEPCNCKWGTDEEQSVNKRSNIFLQYNGERKTISQWAEEIGVTKSCLFHRFYEGWTAKDIITHIHGKKWMSRSDKHICFNPPFQSLIISGAKYKKAA